MRHPKNRTLKLTLLEVILFLSTMFLSLPIYSQINWATPAHSWGGPGVDYADSVAKDSQGNVYVGGGTNSFGAGGTDVLLLKYDPAGNLLWSKTWGGASDEYATAVGVGPDGFLYVTGGTFSFGAGWFDIFLLKLDLQGNIVWATTWGGGSYDVGHDIGFDSAGNIYVVGEEYSFGPCCSSAVLLKFTPSGGAPIWTAAWKGPATYDTGYSLAVDSNGNVIVAGISWDYSASPLHNSILLVKYDAAGNYVWSKNWATPMPGQDESWSFRGVTTDAAGNIYVGNRHANNCPTTDFSSCDFDNLIIKVDAGGNFQWARLWGGPGYDNAGSLAIDPAGHLLVSAIGNVFGTPELSLLSFDTSGTVLLKTVWNTKTAPTINWAGMALDETGIAVIAAAGFNNSGSWITADLPNVISLPDSFIINSFSTSSPAGFSLQLTIPTTAQTGSEDTGAGGADALITVVRFSSRPPDPRFLTFPLHGETASSAIISTVMDHHIAKDPDGNPLFYASDNFVDAYTGEEGALNCSPATSPCAALDSDGNQQSPAGYKNMLDKLFMINNHYTGGSPCYDDNGKQISCQSWLFYEGHPGFDFPAALGTAVYAPARGVAFIPDCDPVTRRADCTGTPSGGAVDGFNILTIDHGNGYSTWYLHMGDLEKTNNELATIPSKPFQITVAHSAFQADLGVVYAQKPKRKLKKVFSKPTSGQYSVNANGVYTFSSADSGLGVLISYYYAIDLRVISCPGQPSVALKRGDHQRISVTPDCIIGEVGNKAIDLKNNSLPLGAHLHFEVRKGLVATPTGIYQCALPSCVPVDPYGWRSTTLKDPYPFGPNILLWNDPEL
jgi:murein DD-endopeptidase MepM/ murein hydrolase activator NlpD